LWRAPESVVEAGGQGLVEVEGTARSVVGRGVGVGGALPHAMHASRGPPVLVGVTPDVRLRGPAQAAAPIVFQPLAQTQAWDSYFNIVYRTSGPAAALAEPVRAALREVAPGAALLEVASFDEWLRHAPGYAEARFRALVAGLLGAAALLLALVGVYGVAAYSGWCL